MAQDVRMSSIPFPMYWENQPKSAKVEKDQLIIESGAKTDMFRDPNVTYNTDNAPKLMFRPDTDFILTAGIHHVFASKWDGGAIVLRRDSLNWVKFCFEKDYTGARRVVSVVTRDISDDCNSVEIPADKVYYKIARAGKVITLYYSLDNKKWFLVRHLQFPDDKPLSVGFLAQSPDGPSCKVTFSEISYRAKKISDPYIGE
jgi:regulation of enolase protein 1 (concanavalin A-like superfamily)